MKALVIGLGSIGMRHARNLKTLDIGEIVGMDPSAERRDRFSAEIGGVAFASFDEALGAHADVAFVCSPNALHVPQAARCASAGCHLFIEKPLAVSRDGLDGLIAAVNERGLYAHVGSNWKFHPAFKAMKQAIEARSIGTVTGAQVLAGQWLPDWHPWEDYRNGYSARSDLGGGIVFDSHEFDYVTWLLGPVAQVAGYSTRSGVLETQTDDVACACLRLESGALVTIHVDYIQRVLRRRYHISGADGTLEWDLQDGCLRLFRSGAEFENLSQPVSDLNQMYLDQSRSVIEGIATGKPPVTPLAHAARVLDLQLAVAAAHA